MSNILLKDSLYYYYYYYYYDKNLLTSLIMLSNIRNPDISLTGRLFLEIEFNWLLLHIFTVKQTTDGEEKKGTHQQQSG